MILVDSDIPMYLVGADSRHKAAARHLLERTIAAGDRLVTDAEVLQEILHRYVAIGRREAIEPAFDVLSALVDAVFPIEREDVDQARRLVLSAPRLSARDALHVAIMYRHRIGRILTFDRGFDDLTGIVRLHE